MRYRKRPVEIEAIKWDGENLDQLEGFMGDAFLGVRCYHPETERFGWHIGVRTLEGKIWADRGNYIIKGVCGECYPCRADIFEQTYELVE